MVLYDKLMLFLILNLKSNNDSVMSMHVTCILKMNTHTYIYITTQAVGNIFFKYNNKSNLWSVERQGNIIKLMPPR